MRVGLMMHLYNIPTRQWRFLITIKVERRFIKKEQKYLSFSLSRCVPECSRRCFLGESDVEISMALVDSSRYFVGFEIFLKRLLASQFSFFLLVQISQFIQKSKQWGPFHLLTMGSDPYAFHISDWHHRGCDTCIHIPFRILKCFA